MMANLLPKIFTLDIGGKPALTFEAKNLREAWEAPPSPACAVGTIAWQITGLAAAA
jgi:hypothetical protein